MARISNANWEKATDAIVIPEPESALSDWPPVNGAVFVATDTRTIYQDDGESWNAADRAVGSLTLDDYRFGRDGDGTATIGSSQSS